MSKAAQSVGYEYTSISPDRMNDADEQPPFAGVIGVHRLRNGVALCASDLVTLRDTLHDGQIERSLTIAIALNGDPVDCEFGPGRRLYIEPGHSAIVSASDVARLASRVKAGQSHRGLIVRFQPDHLMDEEVVETVDQLTRSTSITELRLPLRTCLLVEDLFEPQAIGAVGTLLAESCASDLLAQTLITVRNRPAFSTPNLSRKDRIRLHRVRDYLLAEPEIDHSLTDLARIAGLSVSALKAKFPVLFGMPVFAFLRDVRLDRARTGIVFQGWTVAQAAFFTGYRHQSNFSAAFRRKFGIAPSTLRRR
ncbi:MAG: AraC family transcriptional regulator [Pseudomonadota bacterium]